MDLANVVDVHDGRTVDANEPARIEFALELFDGFTKQVLFVSHMQADVVVSCFYPADLIYVHEEVFRSRMNYEASYIAGRCGRSDGF